MQLNTIQELTVSDENDDSYFLQNMGNTFELSKKTTDEVLTKGETIKAFVMNKSFVLEVKYNIQSNM